MWNLSRLSYYADFVTIPIIALAALASDISYHGLTLAAVAMFVLGMVLWSFVEYAVHRWVFHRAYRREHWVHHIRPAAYVGVPSWQTLIGFLLFLGGCWGSLGLDRGTGLFVGFAAGYFVYIWAHDRFHHGHTVPGTYWHHQRYIHSIHHRGRGSANFGVASPLWDMVLGTFRSN